jgi:hypothetical protein
MHMNQLEAHSLEIRHGFCAALCHQARLMSVAAGNLGHAVQA